MGTAPPDRPGAKHTYRGVVLVALDVGYETRGATERGRCGVVGFERWEAADAVHERTVEVDDVRPYVPGRLFERELPCLLAGLEALGVDVPLDAVTTIIVDGNVRLDQAGRAGLGMHLHRALDSAVPVVGVAKRPFRGLEAVEVRRGTSSNPLHVTAVGIDEHEAAQRVQAMAGEHRLPTLLRRVDQLANGV